ncbi:hypothetical protein FOZ62_014276, partial [Perkinsus olseni]
FSIVLSIMFTVLTFAVLGMGSYAQREGCSLGDFACRIFTGYSGATCDHPNGVCLSLDGPSMMPCACENWSSMSVPSMTTLSSMPVSTSTTGLVSTTSGNSEGSTAQSTFPVTTTEGGNTATTTEEVAAATTAEPVAATTTAEP